MADLGWRKLGPGPSRPPDEPLYDREELLGLTPADFRIPVDPRESLPKAAVQSVITTAEAAGDGQLQVALGGQDIENAAAQSSSSSALAGVALASIVLGAAFGALFAAFLPLITALIAIAVGYSRCSGSSPSDCRSSTASRYPPRSPSRSPCWRR